MRRKENNTSGTTKPGKNAQLFSILYALQHSLLEQKDRLQESELSPNAELLTAEEAQLLAEKLAQQVATSTDTVEIKQLLRTIHLQCLQNYKIIHQRLKFIELSLSILKATPPVLDRYGPLPAKKNSKYKFTTRVDC